MGESEGQKTTVEGHARKLSLLDIPDAIYNFIFCFLEDRSHVTRYAGRTSEIAHINASVVQGSGSGPSSFDVVASDLYSSTRPTPSSSMLTTHT